MAVWQCKLKLLPRRKVIAVCGCVPERLENDVDASWRGVEIRSDYRQILGSFVDGGQPVDWNPELIMWGDEKGDRIDVHTEQGKAIGLSVLIDAGSRNRDFLRGLIDFAQRCDCLILTEERALLEPEEDLFDNSLRRSSAARFVADPRAFLEALS